MNKSGQEINYNLLFGAIAAIIVFIILFVFVTRQSPSIIGQSDREICKLSIIERATLPEVAQRAIPLKCTPEKICFSTNGEPCQQLSGEKEVRSIKLPSNTQAAARTIEKIYAEEMYDCWNMAGRGLLDIFPAGEGTATDFVSAATDLATGPFTVKSIHPKCIICSRLALSNELKTKPEGQAILEQVKINDYLRAQVVPGTTKTYLQTFTDDQVSSYPQEFSQQLTQGGASSTNQVAIIFMQLLSDKGEPIQTAVEKGAYAGLAVGGLLLMPTGGTVQAAAAFGKVGSVLGPIVIAYAAAVVITGVAAGIDAGLTVRENQAIAAAHCTRFTSTFGTPEKGRYGCSILAPMDFNRPDQINNFCNGGIESSL